MENLLYVTAFPPNHKSGGQTFAYNAIQDLSSKYTIDLIYFTYPGHGSEVDKFVRKSISYTPSYKNCLAHPNYLPPFTKRYIPALAKRIDEICKKYDVVYFDYIQTAMYSKYIDHPNKVIRCHDILAQKYLRKNIVIGNWVKKNEYSVLNTRARIFVPSVKDAELVKKLYGLKAEYSNEYVQHYYYSNSGIVTNKILFFGLWSRPENLNGLIWFIDKVYPLLKKDKYKIEVMGGGLDFKINEKFLKPNSIEYLGFVNDSYSEIASSAATIVPLFEGAGIKVKVLDSFATGTPVIGTDIAFEGIPSIEGLSYHANTAQEFAKIINELKTINIVDKENLQKEFLMQYDNRHLSSLI